MIWNNELTDSLAFVVLPEQACIFQMLSLVMRSDQHKPVNINNFALELYSHMWMKPQSSEKWELLDV